MKFFIIFAMKTDNIGDVSFILSGMYLSKFVSIFFDGFNKVFELHNTEFLP